LWRLYRRQSGRLVRAANSAFSGSHFKIRYGDKQTIFPNHGAKEISEHLRKDIIKQPGLTE